jgi:two-component system response regulator QseB
MRLLLVEDDVMLGKATAAGLKANHAVDWCQNAEDAEDALRTTDYAAVVLDVNLPGKSGLDFLKKIRARRDNRPVLLLTARDAVHHRIEGLNTGADDYLVKPFDLDELLARVNALIRRSQGHESLGISVGDLMFDFTKHSVVRGGKNALLSAREYAIIEILIKNRGRVISRAQIEERIYDWSSEDIESNTIEVHISSLRRKLGKDLIKTIRGLGYIVPQ